VNGEDAPLRALVREHVLILDRVQSSSLLPMPAETTLAFTFDAQLDYLVFLDLARRFGRDLQRLGEELALDERNAGADATPFGPLVGGLRVLVVESLHTAAHTPAELHALLAALGPKLRCALFTEVLGAGLERRCCTAFFDASAVAALGEQAVTSASAQTFGVSQTQDWLAR
jgi:hypothetical protein